MHLHVDGGDYVLEAAAPTVRLALREAGIVLGELDRVEPPLWMPLRPGLSITVTRYLEEREERLISPTVRLVRDEFLPPEESRIVEEGAAGFEELVYHVAYDGPLRLGRELVARRIVVPPREQVRLVGTKGTIPSVPISGTIAYINNGDAWIMRRESGHKRPLTRKGRLDGRVFDLSPGGRTLLYTVVPTRSDALLNELWVVDTELLNSQPQPTGIANLLWAAWSPKGTHFAYSTALPTQGAPGWRALNDLYLVSWPMLERTQVLSRTTSFIYSWWGERWAWSPEGDTLAYARADELGLLDLESGQRHTLSTFRPFHTHGDWVWLPQMTWAPNGKRLAATVHHGEEEEATFPLVLINTQVGALRELLPNVGTWAGPAWSPDSARLVLGMSQAADEEAYRLYQVMTSTWGEPFPLAQKPLVVPYVDLAWAPDGRGLVLAVEGDLVYLDLTANTAQALTATGLASHPRWR